MRVLTKWRNLFLVGFMGTGKTKQAKILAPRLKREIFEMDARIRERYGGMEILEIFRQFGEPDFRKTETEVLLEAVAKKDSIVSCGGGVFCQEEPNPNREIMLRNGVVVWLDVSFGIIHERLQRKKDRPKWSEDDMEKNRRLLEVRRPLYAKADYRIEIVDELRPEEVAERILEAIS